jgi:SAM-dependent methyltransferase
MKSITTGTVKGNLMAEEKFICPVLQEHYNLLPVSKMKFLNTPEASSLLRSLPVNVKNIFLENFLKGIKGVDATKWGVVYDHFQKNSEIIPALTANPGTYTMLERMYHLYPVTGAIDSYLLGCMAGGQALWNRYNLVTKLSYQLVLSVLKNQKNCLMADFGSGPGRNVIEMIKKIPDKNRVSIDCIDNDSFAIDYGKKLVTMEGISQINFVEKSMFSLRYRRSLDIGQLIGVMCGMSYNQAVSLLKILKHHFKTGGKLLAAVLLDEMPKEDLLCSYTLRETADWNLRFRPLGELKRIFEAAGWKYVSYFQEEPTRFYEIGIGEAI